MNQNKIPALLAAAFALSVQTANANGAADIYDNLPFKMERVVSPSIPNYAVNIGDFGGKPDGRTLNTEAFKKAIAHLANHGGGRLNVPFGVWYTGSIELKSNIELHLEDGALLLFSSNRADYPLVDSYFEGVRSRRCMSPITAFNATNIAITGRGVLNGNGQCWRPVKKNKLTADQWKKVCLTGTVNKKQNVWYPSEQICEINENHAAWMVRAHRENSDSVWNKVHDFLRPVLVSFIGCKNVLLQDATFENSPSWNIHPLMCENITVKDVTIRNPWFAQNGDGIDIESCKNVVLTGTTLDVGDDAICIKSGRDKEGRDRGMPTENVIVSDCRVYHGHGGFVVGSEMSGGARNILVRRCQFIGTDAGLRFKSTRGRGGVVEKIYIDGVGMADIAGDALTIDLYYSINSNGAAVSVADETTPSFRDINIKNVVCKGAARAMLLNGLPEMPVKAVSIANSVFETRNGASLNHVDGLTMENVAIDCSDGETIKRGENVANVAIK